MRGHPRRIPGLGTHARTRCSQQEEAESTKRRPRPSVLGGLAQSRRIDECLHSASAGKDPEGDQYASRAVGMVVFFRMRWSLPARPLFALRDSRTDYLLQPFALDPAYRNTSFSSENPQSESESDSDSDCTTWARTHRYTRHAATSRRASQRPLHPNQSGPSRMSRGSRSARRAALATGGT